MKKGRKRASKKKITILAIILVIIALALVLGFNYNKWFNSESKINQEPSGYEKPSSSNSNYQITIEKTSGNKIELSASRLQALFSRSNYFTELNSNAKILLTFWDGNGVPRSEKFFIQGSGIISDYNGESYDIELSIGDYSVPRLEASADLCIELTKMVNEQDLRASIKNVLSFYKYTKLKSCVDF